MEEEQIALVQSDGKDAYNFSCPFCSQFITNKKVPKKKTGNLIKTGRDSWKFICTKGGSRECNRKYGGERSLHNFLAMLNPTLFKRYRNDLTTL